MNEYGLDVHYFKKNLNKILLEIGCYTPEEMKLALSRLSKVASTAQLKQGLKESGYVDVKTEGGTTRLVLLANK